MAEEPGGGETDLSPGRIFRFWLPLAATWLMMAAEGPLIAAVIARLPEAKVNLAAYGVTFAFALILEAPIMMVMSAATALVRSRHSYLRLRNFTYALNLGLTAATAVLLAPPLFVALTGDLMGLPPEVRRHTWQALALMLPWPAAIGYRRLFQGILIRHGQTRRVAYGTAVRLGAMASTALGLYRAGWLPGASVGAATLTVAVLAEAVATRLMARRLVVDLLAGRGPGEAGAAARDRTLSYATVARFYYPLALTSFLSLAVQPLVTFFLGQSRAALESLAVLPVVHSLVFLFRSFGLAYQETGIALLGERQEGFAPLARFATLLGLTTTATLALIAFVPWLSGLWFEGVSGLTAELAAFAVPPLRILAPMPALVVLLCFERALVIHRGTTRPLTLASSIEVVVIALALFVGVRVLDLVGVVAAALALVAGRLSSNLYLLRTLVAARGSGARA